MTRARVAIVGAGPAGSSAGWHLASRGHEVTLIDRADFPRPKTCGDWITLQSIDELARLGMGRSLLEQLATEYAPVQTTVLVAPNLRSTICPGRETAYGIPRLVFDALLWQRAVAAGCTPVRRTIRAIGTGDGDFLRDWDHVIDARGAHAGDPNGVALRAYWAVPRTALDTGESARVQIHTDPLFRRGYGWIFPVHAHDGMVRFNVGVGLWAADSVRGRGVREFFERFVSTNPALQRWRDAAQPGRPVGCHVGLGIGGNRVADARLLRIGDAANLADPLTGDGIGNALKSGRLVADAIVKGADRPDAAARWQRHYDREFMPEFRKALLLRHVLARTSAKNLAAQLLDAAPRVRRRVHAALFGEITYGELGAFWR
jgi:flavin-dependent dehydrogenase